MTLDRCGCCKGVEELTPAVISNRPGLSILSHRMGTHWSFLQTMKSCLSAGDYPELRGLSTREKDDFSMAVMDAWAMVADILTFYQERIATEGYLRTATERWSILELARLVGYRLRPGVASSTYLAFTLEKGYELEIPKGTRAQSLPDPGEQPQSFETMEKVWAREEWGRLLPRTTKPPNIKLNPSAEKIDHLYVQGLNHELKANYPIVFDFGSTAIARSIASVELQPEKNRTRINLIPLKIDAEAKEEEAPQTQTLNDLASKLIPKTKEPTAWQPRIEDAFGYKSDSHLQVFATQYLSGENQKKIYAALKGDLLSAEPVLKSVRAFGLSAPVFGHNAPEEQIRDENGMPTGSSREWAIGGRRTIGVHVFLAESKGLKKAKTKPETPTFSWPELKAQITTRSKNSRGSREVTLVPFEKNYYDVGDEKVSIEMIYTAGGNELANVIDTQPVRLIGIFIFKSESLKKEKTIEIDWSDPDPDNLSAIVKLNGFLQQLNGTGNWEKLIQGNSIKIKYASKFDIQIEEESDLPLQEGDKDRRSIVLIDAPGRNIASGTWVVIDRPCETDNTKNLHHETDNTKIKRIFAQVDVSDPITKSDYGIQATVTPFELRSPCYQQILDSKGILAEGSTSILKSSEWLSDKDTSLYVIRNTAVYAENSELILANYPIDDTIGGKEIELDGLFGSLEPGRLLIVSGERADLPGVTDTELAVLSGTFQGKHKDKDNEKEIESDTLHTFLRLADPLGHEYKRDTVTIFANVTRATHGETREEVLGSGDGSKNFQEFYLRQSPLTYLAAPTPAGAESTLDLRVNGVLWHEKDSLLQEGPRDRSFITKTDNEDKTVAIFGDGVHGARLPSGVENIKAIYRTGIGKAGNVRANQITILASKPLGLKEVINPLPATGGADRDTIDQARRNIPLTAMSLDHLVSVKDYEDFARSFAAIGKASATHLSDGRRQLVHVTIAGKGNAPIDETSDLYLNLVQALFKFGDPNLAIQVDMSEQRLLLMDAEVSIGADYLWSEVEPKIRAKLLERFGFERRELGQDIHLSEVISAMMEIDGVTYVDVNIFHDLPDKILPESLERLIKFILEPPPDGIYRPNQCVHALRARIEGKYEAEGWEDLLIIRDRYGMDDEDLNELREQYKEGILSWNKISGEDYGELKNFLSRKFGVDVVYITVEKKKGNDVFEATVGSKYISLKLNSSKTKAILESTVNMVDEFRVKEDFILSWEDFIETNEAKRREFIKQNFGIEPEKIEKIETNVISANGKSLSLILNPQKNEFTLKIDGKTQTEFTAEKEGKKLDIYKNGNLVFSWKYFTIKDKALREFLKQNFQNFSIDPEKIEKIDNIIVISANGKSLSLKFNPAETEVALGIGNNTIRFRAKIEDDKLNIYELNIYLTAEKGTILTVPRTIMPAQIAFFNPYVKEMLNLRPRVSRNE